MGRCSIRYHLKNVYVLRACMGRCSKYPLLVLCFVTGFCL